MAIVADWADVTKGNGRHSGSNVTSFNHTLTNDNIVELAFDGRNIYANDWQFNRAGRHPATHIFIESVVANSVDVSFDGVNWLTLPKGEHWELSGGLFSNSRQTLQVKNTSAGDNGQVRGYFVFSRAHRGL